MQKLRACVDGAAYTPSVCDLAAWAALRLEIPVELLHVLDRHPEHAPVMDFSGSIGLGASEALLSQLSELDEQRSRLAQEHGRQLLEGARTRVAAAGVTAVDLRQRHGALVDTLLDVQAQTRLFVLGQHYHLDTPGKVHLDHTLERAIRAVQQPVLVAAEAFREPRSFLIAFDGSQTGRKMVDKLAMSPLLSGLSCHLVNVSHGNSEAGEALEWAKAALQRFDPTVRILSGEPEVAIIDYLREQDLDLLVMGAYGHSRIRQLIIGSTTASLLRSSPVAALVLR
ncbi:universal stress protein [Algiphilus sp. W345]|uniref:Universal stress protein n=1 Tax=Banduia mediterranea TaxID=3075609 RepID=A0ABU2WLB0_9GAMM|nr:universal stress protein [Algiphilus sp. W345]MDT0498310.1 universal stress protein [Algiphilus sp. W345]